MGSIVVRHRKNKDYSYYVYYDDNKRIEVYCGPTNNSDTQMKLWECEFKELSKQELIIKNRIMLLKNKIKTIC